MDDEASHITTSDNDNDSGDHRHPTCLNRPQQPTATSQLQLVVGEWPVIDEEAMDIKTCYLTCFRLLVSFIFCFHSIILLLNTFIVTI
jgi:hypothetical protein